MILNSLSHECTNQYLMDLVRVKLLFGRNWQFSRSEYLQILLNNKKNLFLTLSILITVAIAYPIILPHIHHPSMIYHIIVHKNITNGRIVFS